MGSPRLSPVGQKSRGPGPLMRSGHPRGGQCSGTASLSLTGLCPLQGQYRTELSTWLGWDRTQDRLHPQWGSPAHLYSQPCTFLVTDRARSVCQESTEGPPSPGVIATILGRSTSTNVSDSWEGEPKTGRHSSEVPCHPDFTGKTEPWTIWMERDSEGPFLRVRPPQGWLWLSSCAYAERGGR